MSDVFISYAHTDNPGLDDDGRGWVSRFHQVLGKLLTFYLGKPADIWRDPRLEGNDVFEAVILEALVGSRALVSVVSPRYVQSEWCTREVAEFWRRAQAAGRLQVANKSRLLKVLTQPLALPENVAGKPLPAEVREFFNTQIGVDFFERDAESGRVRVLREEFGEEFKHRFFQKVDDVANALAEVLKAESSQPPPPVGKTVYLALTSHDLAAERDQLERELRERGHVVLPGAPLLMVAGEFESAARACLDASALSIHLVGGRYGVIPEDATESVAEIQNRLAAERAAAGALRRLIWIPRGVQPRNPRQQEFLRRLQEDAAAQRGAEVVQDSLEKLKGLMLEILEPPPKPAVPAAVPAVAAAGAVVPGVYLIADACDAAPADAIEDFLFEQGLEVRRLPAGGSEAQAVEAHQFNLRNCDAALIYQGDSSRLWVDVKLQDLQRAPGLGRARPWQATAVCLGPPDHRDKQRFRTHLAEVLRPPEPFAASALAPFVERVKAAAGGATP